MGVRLETKLGLSSARHTTRQVSRLPGILADAESGPSWSNAHQPHLRVASQAKADITVKPLEDRPHRETLRLTL